MQLCGFNDPRSLGERLANRRHYMRWSRCPPNRRARLCPFQASPGDSGVDALADYLTFELREYAEHLKHRLTAWGSRVDTLAMQVQVNAFRMEFAERFEQVLELPAKAVDRPYSHDIELSPTHFLKHAVETWPLSPSIGAADAGWG